jgi:hypothetical protein
LADLEARVAALEADRADYRAVLAATGALRQRVDGMDLRFDRVDARLDGIDRRFDDLAMQTNANRESINALGEKLAGFQTETRARFEAVEQRIDREFSGLRQEMNGRFRSVDEQLAEVKDLIVDGFRWRSS